MSIDAARPACSDPATRAVLEALGLARVPFPTTPDAEHYFQTAELTRDMAEAAHCLLARKGFVLLTGEVGQGKTTFLRRLLLAVEAEGARASLIFNTFLQGPDLLAAVLRDFGLKPRGDAATDIDRLNRFLLERWREGRTCVLFVDDAQNLDVASLEVLRLLTNLESGQEKLLQIVLAGQPELEATLARHDLRQLASRIVKHVRLRPLDAAETASYVAFRLARAGESGRIAMAPGAHAALFRDSAGNPRRVHLIMDRCLYGVIASGRPRIDAALVRRAAGEAGFARRTPRRWLAGASVALAVAAGLATAATLRDWRTPAAAPAASPVAAMVTAPVAAMTPDDGYFAPCVERLSLAADANSGTVQIVAVDAHLAPRLASRADVCTASRNGGLIAAWATGIKPADVLEGARGDAVLALQSQLLAAGAFGPADTLRGDPRDGRLGPDTRAALADFQAAQRLPRTGLADPLTLLLLHVATARPTDAALHPETPHVRG